MELPKPKKRVKTNGSEGRRFTPSFDVFWKYISFSDEDVDVSGIFTKPCFNEWIATRTGKEIVHPEQSFQRVLYAHIRGADHRKPFPEHVEREILKLLRSGRDSNPWNKLFGDVKLRVGRRGFKSKGYHEAIRDKSNGDSSGDHIAPSSSGNNSPSSGTSPHSNTFQESQRNFGQYFQNPPANLNYSSFFPQINTYWPLSVRNMNDINDATLPINTPWDMVSYSLSSHLPFEKRKMYLEAANACGLDLFSSYAYNSLQVDPDPRDVRYNWSFLLPPPEERKFLEDRLTGVLTISSLNIIMGEDTNAVAILKGSSIGKHVMQLANNLVTVLYATIKHIPEIMSNGFVWRREVLRKHNGQLMVCMHKIEMVGNEFKMTIQDHSDLQTEALHLSMLSNASNGVR